MNRHAFAAVSILAAIAGPFLMAAPAPAAGVKATNLKCKGCVNRKDIAKKAVTGDKIKKNAVTSDKIKNGSVQQVDLAKDARPGGADTFSINGMQSLATGVDTELAATTVTSPSSGIALVFASAYVDLNNDTASNVECSINDGGATVSTVQIVVGGNGSQVGTVPLSAHRSFEITPGDNEFNFVCMETGGNVEVHDVNLSALFVQNRL
jgi:hypothetical protein